MYAWNNYDIFLVYAFKSFKNKIITKPTCVQNLFKIDNYVWYICVLP